MRIAARMAAQRGLGLFRAAEESSRSTVEAGQPPCASACAVEALPSSQTAEQPASREAAVQAEQLPRAVSATVLGAIRGRKKNIFEKRLRVRRAHPCATPPCKRLILGALRGSVGAIHQYFGNGGSKKNGSVDLGYHTRCHTRYAPWVVGSTTHRHTNTYTTR